jgi:excisionase family DNA binding protein
MTTFLTPEEVAKRLRVEKSTLQVWRTRGGGPAYTKVGHRTILYDLKDVEAFEAKRKYNNTAEEKVVQDSAN